MASKLLCMTEECTLLQPVTANHGIPLTMIDRPQIRRMKLIVFYAIARSSFMSPAWHGILCLERFPSLTTYRADCICKHHPQNAKER